MKIDKTQFKKNVVLRAIEREESNFNNNFYQKNIMTDAIEIFDEIVKRLKETKMNEEEFLREEIKYINKYCDLLNDSKIF